jgi:rhodanese-related sulfurtransferase
MFNKLLYQIIILVLIGLILGVLNNTLSSNKIPWIEEYQDLSQITKSDTAWIPWSWEESDSIFRRINVEDAYNAYLQGDAIFIDSRTPEDYAMGHILGAINVDIEADDDIFNAQLDELLQITSMDMKLITYCSGAECDLSLMLARYLTNNIGYSDISIYFGGWEFWQENGLPTESYNE